MSDIIPFIVSQEQARIKKEISKEYVCDFDGTTWLGEVMAVALSQFQMGAPTMSHSSAATCQEHDRRRNCSGAY